MDKFPFHTTFLVVWFAIALYVLCGHISLLEIGAANTLDVLTLLVVSVVVFGVFFQLLGNFLTYLLSNGQKG